MLRSNPRRKPSRAGLVRVWPVDGRDPDALFRDVLDFIDAPIVLLDETGAIVRGNESFRAIVGTEVADSTLPGLAAGRRDGGRLSRALRAALRSGRRVHVEATIRGVLGTPRTVAWTMAPIRVRTPHVLATGSDVTAVRKLRAAMTVVEEVGRILGVLGPTPEALDLVIARLVERLHYPFVAIYLLEGSILRLGAQSGYGDVEYELDTGKGIMARAIRTTEAQLVPDVTRDPDYITTGTPVRGEICAPLVADGHAFGVLNVETRETDPLLDGSDLGLMQAVADRLASAIVLGRERVELARRAEALRASEAHARSTASRQG